MSFTAYRTPFSLLNEREIEAEARPERNPFYEYFREKPGKRLFASRIELVGISAAFPAKPILNLPAPFRQLLPSRDFGALPPAVLPNLSRAGEHDSLDLNPDNAH